ncbi:hypothetical protein GN958_ATG21192 [Phytophthora infestans]|uniref:BED-type domain-containing protein n=1 Tax=Phytophthora infestans TaxID=4787 RepID=A0A8S9TRY8_PHYIN|nr:hypothetical protein GN958_ATG21192 [Phytophthora infestans]
MEEDTPSPSSPPPLQLFKMTRVHKQEYWSFARLVAPNTEMPPGLPAWKTTNAELAYCLKCKTTFKNKSESSAKIRKHMTHEHPLELGGVGRDAAVKRVTNALASKRESSAAVFSPTKRRKKVNPAEEELATRALIEWIAKCLRSLSIVENEELSFFYHIGSDYGWNLRITFAQNNYEANASPCPATAISAKGKNC